MSNGSCWPRSRNPVVRFVSPHNWSMRAATRTAGHSYTRRCRNVLSMQSEVAAAIARDVNAVVLTKEEASGISLPRSTLIGPIN